MFSKMPSFYFNFAVLASSVVRMLLSEPIAYE